MIDYTTPSGYRVRYDDTIQVGDFIKAYHKGLHKVTGIERRGKHNTPLFYYVKVGPKSLSNTVRRCDGAYCRKVTGPEDIAKYYEDALVKIHKLIADEITGFNKFNEG